MTELNRMTIPEFKASDKLPVVIVLDNIRSQNNTGSVFRTADAFRVAAVYLCGITATPPHREIQKTALGATESVEWHYRADTREAITELKSLGYKVLAVEQVAESQSLHDFEPGGNDKIAVIFGNEVNGIDDQVLSEADGFLEIPQFGTKHSINISVAVGIVIWDIFVKLKKIKNL